MTPLVLCVCVCTVTYVLCLYMYYIQYRGPNGYHCSIITEISNTFAYHNASHTHTARYNAFLFTFNSSKKKNNDNKIPVAAKNLLHTLKAHVHHSL